MEPMKDPPSKPQPKLPAHTGTKGAHAGGAVAPPKQGPKVPAAAPLPGKHGEDKVRADAPRIQGRGLSAVPDPQANATKDAALGLQQISSETMAGSAYSLHGSNIPIEKQSAARKGAVQVDYPAKESTATSQKQSEAQKGTIQGTTKASPATMAGSAPVSGEGSFKTDQSQFFSEKSNPTEGSKQTVKAFPERSDTSIASGAVNLQQSEGAEHTLDQAQTIPEKSQVPQAADTSGQTKPASVTPVSKGTSQPFIIHEWSDSSNVTGVANPKGPNTLKEALGQSQTLTEKSQASQEPISAQPKPKSVTIEGNQSVITEETNSSIINQVTTEQLKVAAEKQSTPILHPTNPLTSQPQTFAADKQWPPEKGQPPVHPHIAPMPPSTQTKHADPQLMSKGRWTVLPDADNEDVVDASTDATTTLDAAKDAITTPSDNVIIISQDGVVIPPSVTATKKAPYTVAEKGKGPLQPEKGPLQPEPGTTAARSFASLLQSPVSNVTPLPSFNLTSSISIGEDGTKMINFTQEDVDKAVANMENTLVMKFNNTRPTIDAIRSTVSQWKLSQDAAIGPLDGRHVLLRLMTKDDLRIAWLHDSNTIMNIGYRLMKWSPQMGSRTESPVVVRWIRLPGLLPHFCTRPLLQLIGDGIAKFMDADTATLNTTRPSQPRISVEVDVSKPLPNKIRIQVGKEGAYWQRVIFEGNPIYCTHCSMHGHSLQNCRRKNNTGRKDRAADQKDKPSTSTAQTTQPKKTQKATTQTWQPKITPTPTANPFATLSDKASNEEAPPKTTPTTNPFAILAKDKDAEVAPPQVEDTMTKTAKEAENIKGKAIPTVLTEIDHLVQIIESSGEKLMTQEANQTEEPFQFVALTPKRATRRNTSDGDVIPPMDKPESAFKYRSTKSRGRLRELQQINASSITDLTIATEKDSVTLNNTDILSQTEEFFDASLDPTPDDDHANIQHKTIIPDTPTEPAETDSVIETTVNKVAMPSSSDSATVPVQNEISQTPKAKKKKSKTLKAAAEEELAAPPTKRKKRSRPVPALEGETLPKVPQ
nr:DUF4283 domain-containing protein [Erythronium dens-canis]